MLNLKKIISGAMTGVLMASILLSSGCSANKNGTDNSSAPATTAAATQAAPTPQPKVDLVWYLRGSVPKNADSVLAKVNELTEQKINASLTINFIEPGDYDNKISIIMGAGEVFDLSFTSSWANPYRPNVLKGAYLPLDDLLAKFPDLKQLMDDQIWDGTRVNGKIYGVPNLQLMYDQPGIWMKKDLVEKYSIDVNSIKTNSDLTAIYQKIKDNEPDIIPVSSGFGDYSVKRSGIVGDVVLNVTTWKVEDLQQANYDNGNWKLMREWNQKGFFPADIATLKDVTPLFKAGKIFSSYSRQKPGGDAEIKAKFGYDVVMVPLGPMSISQGSITSTLTAISTTSKNPERAMALINLMANDKDMFRTLTYGLENQDYKKVSDDRIEPVAGAYALSGWMLGNTFNGYLLPGNQDNLFEQTKQFNKQAIVDPAVKFSFDSSALTTEIAQMQAVSNEYMDPLKNGIDDIDKMMKSRSEKMKQAGMDKVMAEAQKQVDAWRAGSK